jgi:hypothetical protein
VSLIANGSPLFYIFARMFFDFPYGWFLADFLADRFFAAGFLVATGSVVSGAGNS